MIRRPPRSTQSRSSAASDVYKRQLQALKELHSLDYVGPQYGADKKTFFDSIDALIFPTRYANEAEPLTIHEAATHGLSVIAYGRGSIPEIVGSDCGLVIDPAETLAPAALAQIRSSGLEHGTGL